MTFSLAVRGMAADSPGISVKIDAIILAKAVGAPASAAADDAEFLRRVWRDFDGGVPTADEARDFFADKTADKRARLIDTLMNAPRFAERMADAFNVMLMERRGEDAEWKGWLTASFREHKPWDAMVREMLAPDFVTPRLRGAGYFLTKRLEVKPAEESDYPGVARDVGRLFMGADLQCAQCHRHLTVSDYKQKDFNGLLAVFQNLKFQPKDDNHPIAWLSEGLVQTKHEFVSVLSGKKDATAPRVPFGAEAEIPVLEGDAAWLVKPDTKKKELGKPKFSPMAAMANLMPRGENNAFARNIANRVWFLLIGRGLVEPLDLHHSKNPASHPELLDLLTTELIAHHFDLQWLIREIALTEVYQRSGLLPAGEAPAKPLFLTALERPLTADQQLRAFWIITRPDQPAEGQKYKLPDFEKAFLGGLANPAKEPELAASPTLRSSLFFRNSLLIHGALKPRPGNFIDRLTKHPDAVTELYLTILTRLPDSEEHAVMKSWLEQHGGDKAKALSDAAWSLISSTEFFVNH